MALLAKLSQQFQDRKARRAEKKGKPKEAASSFADDKIKFGRDISEQVEEAKPVVKGAGSLLGAIVRAFPRAATSIGVSGVEKITGKPEEFTPETKFEKVLFGKQPVRGFKRQTERTEEDLQKTFKASEGVAKGAAPVLVAGSIVADLIPGIGGARKKIAQESIEQIAKLSKADDIVQELKRVAPALDEAKAAQLAGELENVSDVNQIRSKLFSVGIADELRPKIQRIIGDEDRAGFVADEIADSASKTLVSSKKTGLALTREVEDNIRASLSSVPDIGNRADEILLEQPEQMRGLAESLIREGKVVPDVERNIKEARYTPLANRQVALDVDDFMQGKSIDESVEAFKTSKQSTFNNALGLKLLDDLQVSGEFNRSNEVAEKLLKDATEAGRSVQILATVKKMTPQGIVLYAKRQAKAAGVEARVTEDVIKRLTAKANKLQEAKAAGATMKEELKLAHDLMKEVSDILPVSVLKKIGTAQTIAQLLNPKTFVRNILGNAGFMASENLSDVFAAALDFPTSLITGKRATALPRVGAQLKGFKKGAQEGFAQALGRAPLSGPTTQMDLSNTPVFKKGPMKVFEKGLNLALRVADRAFYQAAFDGSIAKQMKAAGVKAPTDEMIEKAHYDGLYRTFQDDSSIAQVFGKIKKGLNAGKEFGVGDFVLKYPKTPANLLSRGIAYSPAGFVNTVMELGKPLFGKGFDQKKFVEATSRALVGSGMGVGTGIMLHKLGIITAKRPEDYDTANLQRVEGLRSYGINTSALKRFIESGFDADEAKLKKGDHIASYDWMQPAAMSLSIGANIDDTKGSKESIGNKLLEMAKAGVSTITEQPLVSGVERLFTQGDVIKGLEETAKGIPSSFVPTALAQLRQLLDDTARETYSPSAPRQALNLAINRVPGLSQKLPAKETQFGKAQSIYGAGKNNLFNVFFNPALTAVYNPSPEAELVLDLYADTGETGQIPPIMKKTIQINGESKKLTTDEYVQLQKYSGTIAREKIHRLATSSKFQRLPADVQVEIISDLLSDIGSASKIRVLGNRPKRVSNSVKNLLEQYPSVPRVEY